MNTLKTFTFLTFTILWSWISWIVGLNILSRNTDISLKIFVVFFFLGVYGPSISAIATTFLFDGLSGLKTLLKKLFIWKVSIRIYLYVIFLPILFVLIGIALYQVCIESVGQFDGAAYLAIPATLWSGFYVGPLGEELGWRGFLLPEFQKKFSSLNSALLIGVIWFIWHIPLFWSPFGTLASGSSFTPVYVIVYLIILTCLSVIITWLVNQAKGSVLIAILFHLSINAGIALLFFPELQANFRAVHILSCAGMIVFIIFLITKGFRNRENIEHKKP